MQQTSYGQYTTQLTRFPHVFPVSAYLVREDDGCTLVDTTIPRTAVSGTIKPLFPFPAMANWDKLVALQSARRLAALNLARLAVGHGHVLETAGRGMNEAIRVAACKLEG